jgi:2'-5' RNA ligase
VTLLFLGSVPATALPALRRASDETTATWPAFEIGLAAGAGRVQRGEGVAWLSVRRGAREVIELAGDLDRAVREAAPAIREPRRAPSAHLTVARRADRSLLDALLHERHGTLRADWLADRVVLMRSHLGRAGAHYERVHETPLSGPRET